ncbi:YfbM family protein [Iodobacter arcticus]|uniref:YfbM family protein n=1 Tax=Iodobacter arcticus TaxID=590593 RepID=A0ABW2R2S9_9NEIS
MSMIACFLAISQDELDALYDESGEIAAVLDGEYAAQIIDIDKAWHGIHFMLTENSSASSPLAHAVLGIKKIGEEDVGYGPAHGISAASVKKIAEALNGISEEAFRAMFDAEAMTNAEIYPDIWDKDDEALVFLLTHFEVLKGFYADTAKAGKAAISFLN